MFLFVVLNILLVTEMIKRIRPLCLILPKKKIQNKYRRYFDETKMRPFW